MLDQDLNLSMLPYNAVVQKYKTCGISYQWLSLGVDLRPVKRVAGYNFYIGRKMLIEGSKFWSLARRLATHYCTDPGCFSRSQTGMEEGNTAVAAQTRRAHTWAILCNYPVNDSGLYTVNNEIANPGHQMSIGKNCDPSLDGMSLMASGTSGITRTRESYSFFKSS